MYFNIEEDGDKFVFHLKKGVPFSTSYLIFKHKKTGKRISKEIKSSKAVISLDELNELDEYGRFNVFVKVLVMNKIFIQRIKFVFQNSNKMIFDKKNHCLLESLQSKYFNLSFIYKPAEFIAKATEFKKENNQILLKGEIEAYDDIDFNSVEILIALTSQWRYMPCNWEKDGETIKFDVAIDFEIDEEDIGNRHYPRIRLKKDDIVIDNARIKAKNIKINEIDDKYLDYIENFKASEETILEEEAKGLDENEYCSMLCIASDSNLIFEILNKRDINRMMKNEKRLLEHFSTLENKKLVFFESFDGKFYAGQSRYIYEKLLELGYDKYFDFVWSYSGGLDIPGNPIITDRDSKNFKKLLKDCEYWITNINFPHLKDEEDIVHLQSTYGTPYKCMGTDVKTNSKKIRKDIINLGPGKLNYLLTANDFSKEVFKSAFGYDGKIINKGYPANDIFYQNNAKKIEQIKKDLNIPKDKKIILYAPSFRDVELSDEKERNYKLLLDLKALHEKLSDDHILIARLHPLLLKDLEIEDGMREFVMDLSDYDEITDLYLISDALITDYSSAFFDYAHSKKPILFFVPDKEEYSGFRGLYSQVEENLPGPEIYDSQELIDAIRNIDDVSEEYKGKYEAFYDKYCNLGHGNSSKDVIDIIFKDVGK